MVWRPITSEHRHGPEPQDWLISPHAECKAWHWTTITCDPCNTKYYYIFEHNPPSLLYLRSALKNLRDWTWHNLCALMSNLAALKQASAIRAAEFAKAYSNHRPLVQRGLTAGFVLYVLGTTYRGLSARPSSSSVRKGKGKGKGKDDSGKPPRVAVRPSIQLVESNYDC